MKPARLWIATALLGGSWLLGMDLYHTAAPWLWAFMLIAATLLLEGAITTTPGRVQSIAGFILTIPLLFFAPWPFKAAPLLILIGLAMLWPAGWSRRLGGAALAAGSILLAQSLALLAYISMTARSHELPVPLAYFVGWIAKLIGIDSTVAFNTAAGNGGVDIGLRTMRKLHLLGATWELFLDPVTLAFLAGGLAMIFLNRAALTQRLKSAGVLTGCVLAWLPIRVALLMSLVMHRALRTEFDATLTLMDQFYSPWFLTALAIVPALLAWRFIRLDITPAPVEPPPFNYRRLFPVGLTALAVTSFTFAALYDPVGIRKSGRVMVDEFHSNWERTDKPMDTTWYGKDSGYNYACIYDYSNRFYNMERLEKQIDANTLNNIDVLIVKCPTKRYAAHEVAHIRDFVYRGGGLLLIGEHTDVFGIGTYANDIAKHFGFEFRYDVLFGVDTIFNYVHHRPKVAHPVAQRMPPMDFEGPATIVPTRSGRPIMLGTGLFNEPAFYYASNFYPAVEDRVDTRYGAWIMAWATKFGKGRVVAHADSTQFSNFSAFEPGKPESWIGMIEWLNHKNGAISQPRLAFNTAGVILLAAAVFFGLRFGGSRLVAVTAGMSAFVFSAMLIRSIHDRSMPPPSFKKDAAPMIMAGIDRVVSEALVSKGGFIGGKPEGYGIFERWILRLGWYIERNHDADLFKNKNLVVIFTPSKDVPAWYRTELAKFIQQGGHVVVIDSPERPEGLKSTTNSLLSPFGMEVRSATLPEPLTVESKIGLPTIPTPSALEVVNGNRTLATIAGKPVAAARDIGKGSLTVIGFGAKFNDSNMGVTGDIEPGEDLQKVYAVQYGILRHIMGQQQIAAK